MSYTKEPKREESKRLREEVDNENNGQSYSARRSCTLTDLLGNKCAINHLLKSSKLSGIIFLKGYIERESTSFDAILLEEKGANVNSGEFAKKLKEIGLDIFIYNSVKWNNDKQFLDLIYYGAPPNLEYLVLSPIEKVKEYVNGLLEKYKKSWEAT